MSKVTEMILSMLPPRSIEIPPTSPSAEQTSSDTSENASRDGVEDMFTRVDEKIVGTIPEESIAEESFCRKVNGDGFKIGAADESDSSVRIEVEAPLFEEDYTNEQLLGYVEQLCNNVKRAERAAKKEKSRRRARETTMMKMAKELKNQNDMIEKLKAKVSELKVEVRMKDSETLLSDQRLRNTMFDLRNAEIKIERLHERQHNQQEPLDGQPLLKMHSQANKKATKKRKPIFLKSVALLLLCTSIFAVMRTFFSCMLSDHRKISNGPKCDLLASLGVPHILLPSKAVRAEEKQDLNPDISVNPKKKKNDIFKFIKAAAVSQNYYRESTTT